MKGSYILVMELKKSQKIGIGKLGIINFSAGYYAYIGSALNNLEKRTERHRRKKKKKKWYIDYFLQKAKIKDVFVKESSVKQECKISRKLAKKYEGIPRFGSSDCKCRSHLFYLGKSSGKKLI